jgi:hypothetical protein
MINHGFDMYRVYLSTPGDLVREQDACRAAISQVNAAEAMPLKILLVSVGLRDDGQIAAFRSAVNENVRQCAYFIQVFEDDWGPNHLYRKLLYLAEDCKQDESLPMRDVIVCLKDAPRETDPAILSFRQELADLAGTRVLHFNTPESLQTQLLAVCADWVRAIEAAGGGVRELQP